MKQRIIMFVLILSAYWGYGQTGVLQLGNDADLAGLVEDDNSGWSISIDDRTGHYVAIGEPWYDKPHEKNVGRVRVFQWDGNHWIQVGSELVGEEAGDLFGWSVSLYRELNKNKLILAIGAPNYNADGKCDAGRTYVYKYDQNFLGNWLWEELPNNGLALTGVQEYAGYGYSVSLSENSANQLTLAVGAPFYYGPAGEEQGYAITYIYNWGGWIRTGSKAGTNKQDRFGYSVALSTVSKERVVVGAPAVTTTENDPPQVGYTKVFDITPPTLTQLGSDIIGEMAGDWSGHSVDISYYGFRVAIGAPFNNVVANPNSTQYKPQAGHTRAYDYDNTLGWLQVGGDIDGTDSHIAAGWAVSMGDYSRIAIGSWGKEYQGIEFAGEARIYQNQASNWNLTYILDPSSDNPTSPAEAHSALGASVSIARETDMIAFGIPSQNNISLADPDNAGLSRVYILITNNSLRTHSASALEENDDVQVFPNPTEGMLHIVGKELIGSSVQVVDGAGKAVKSFVLSEHHIDLSDLPKGFYIVSIHTPTQSIIKQIIKQ